MGRQLARTVVVDEVVYEGGTEVSDEVAAKIGNPKAFEDVEDDTSEADLAAAERARDAFDAGRPIRELSEDELKAWAYDPDLETEEGQAAEARLVGLEQGDAPTPAGGHPPVTGDDSDDSDDDDDDPVDVIDFSDEPPREGTGSGVKAWRAYAEGKGLEVPAEADVDAIRAIVDERKAAQAASSAAE